MENPIKMDDLGGTTIFGNIHMEIYAIKVIEPPAHASSQDFAPLSSIALGGWEFKVVTLGEKTLPSL